jgi:hypothetical protein
MTEYTYKITSSVDDGLYQITAGVDDRIYQMTAGSMRDYIK